MNYPERYAILLDGAFVIKKLGKHHKRFPNSIDVINACERIKKHDLLSGLSLLRIYFYHAPPAKKELTNPIDNTKIQLANTKASSQHYSLLDKLEMCSDFALRLGETVTHGWRLGRQSIKSLLEQSRPVQAKDIVPNIVQKGVDLRIGLDIARLSLQRMVNVVVVATGDSDLVPAFKFARREGVRVYLDHMGHHVRRELKAHTDSVLNLPL